MKWITGILKGTWVEMVVCNLSLGTFCIVLLVVGLWFLGANDSICLQPDLVLAAGRFQVYRLVTYCVCHKDVLSLLASVILLLFMGRWLERRMGTLPFLLLSIVCIVGTALLYILLTKLLGLTSHTICGYSATNFAVLTIMCRKSRGKRLPVIGHVPMVALPLLLLIVAYCCLPGSQLVAHICGVLAGLLYSTGILHCLELSEQQLDKLESLSFCRLISRNSFISFIRAPKRGSLPVTNSIDRSFSSLEQIQAMGHFQNPATSVPGSWMETATAPHFHGCCHGVGIQHWSWPPYDPFCNETSYSSGPKARNLEDAITASDVDFTEENLLRAGIMASLQDSGPDSVAKV